MNLLAIETSCECAGVALQWEGGLWEAPLPSGYNTHSAHVLPAVSSVLSKAGASLAGLDAIAFGAGPGAFTGLRLACAAAQGLGLALAKPVVPVNTLAALAMSVDAPYVLSVLDARMGEVYAQLFHRNAHDHVQSPPQPMKPFALSLSKGIPPVMVRQAHHERGGAIALFHAEEQLTPLGAALCANPETLNWEALGGPPLREAHGLSVVGSGLLLNGQPVQERLRHIGLHSAVYAPDAQPLARHLLLLAPFVPWCSAAEASPFYVREKVALTLSERQAKAVPL